MSSIHVPDHASGRLGDAWRTCIGAGRFDVGVRRDYQDSLALLQREIGFRFIRQHGLLSDGVGIHQPYRYRGARQVRHAFTYLDQVIDAYLELGAEPFVELGFMPSGLASGDETVFWWHGNITPPSSPTEWATLVRATVAHLVDRYGLDRVRGWPIEVWNEPDLSQFWAGADQAAYHELYAVTAHAVKDVDGSLSVGGPALSPGADDGWLPRFAEFVAAKEVPVDFISRHAYTSGPAQHVPFGVHQTLAPAGELLAQFAAPGRQLRDTALAGLPVHITEFNSSYRPDNPIHDTAFHAAYLAPVVVAAGDLVDSFAYWTFCDVFEEIGVPTALFHGGFGLLTHRQIKKPTYHLYAFLARLGDQVLSRGTNHLVTRDGTGRIAVLAWAPVDASTVDFNSTVDGHVVRLSVPLDPNATNAFVRRSAVSDEDGNAWRAWREMGAPASPRPAQLDALREAAEPSRRHSSVPVVAGRVDLEIGLTRNEVTLVELTAVVDETAPWWEERRLLGAPSLAGPEPQDPR